jgi:hypothetical protein
MTRSTQEAEEKTMPRFSGRNFLITMMTFFILLAASSIPVSASIGAPVTCPLSTQAVTIDGKWTSTTEWTDAPEIQMPVAMGNGAGYFRVKHDATTLYILGESLVDTAVEYNSTAGVGDSLSVFLDTTYNQGTAPQMDDYRFIAYYVSASDTQIMTRKGDGMQWVTSVPVQGVHAMVGLDSGNSPHMPHPHVSFEMSIPLSLIPPSQFGFFIRLDDSMIWWSNSDQATMMHFYWPGPTQAQQGIDPTSWGTLTISSTPIPEFASSWLIAFVTVFVVAVFARVHRKSKPN